MKQSLIIQISIILLTTIGIMTSCSKMDSSYKQFIENGEIPYAKQPDSIQMAPGHNRIKLSWLLIASPNIVKCRVYWNNGADYKEVPIHFDSEVDTVSVIIDDLEEGFYTFDIYTYDKNDISSVVKDTTGRVYGVKYIATLLNRETEDAVLIDGDPRITWYEETDSTAIGVEIYYKNLDGVSRNIKVPLTDSITMLMERPLGDSIRYRTLYMPDTIAIDTFYSSVKTLKLSEAQPKKLDKSKFAELPLPTDAPIWLTNSHPMSNLWDDVIKTWYRTINGSGSPHWYTFDLGVKAKLHSYTLWQRGIIPSEHKLLYANANIHKWEIWGSNDPNPDGSWDKSWVKLMDCESVKPSGLPMGMNTAEDIQQATIDGETFEFPAGLPAVRYIRIKILETWDPSNSDHSLIAELTFNGIAL